MKIILIFILVTLISSFEMANNQIVDCGFDIEYDSAIENVQFRFSGYTIYGVERKRLVNKIRQKANIRGGDELIVNKDEICQRFSLCEVIHPKYDLIKVEVRLDPSIENACMVYFYFSRL